MIRRIYLGLDLGPEEIRAVALRRQGRSAALAGGRLLTLDRQVLVPNAREPNIRDRRRFIDSVREVLDPLAGREDRVALSLPEASGRLLFTDIEAPFRNLEEGREILKWQLKQSLPDEARAVQLDFQVIGRSETGRVRLLVALIGRPVLDQYEEVLAEAGYGAQLVDFHPLNLHNFYRPRLASGSDWTLVAIEQGNLSLQFFKGQAPVLLRTVQTDRDPARIFQEVSRTLASLGDHAAGLQRAPVYLHCDWPDSAAASEPVGAAFGRELTLLDAHLEDLAAGSLDLPDWRTRSLAAAIGAATRLM